MAASAVLVTRNPQSTKWQVSRPVDGYFTLIGWHLAEGRPIDDGVPPTVAAILARSLTTAGWATFPTSSKPNQRADDRIQLTEGSGAVERIRAACTRTPFRLWLVSTRQAQTAWTAFEDGIFSWTLQGQVILLSTPELGPPVLDRQTVLSLIAPSEPVDHARLKMLGLSGLICPGVDGDVAALMTATEVLERTILRIMQADAESSGFTWRVLSEDDFTDAL